MNIATGRQTEIDGQITDLKQITDLGQNTDLRQNTDLGQNKTQTQDKTSFSPRNIQYLSRLNKD